MEITRARDDKVGRVSRGAAKPLLAGARRAWMESGENDYSPGQCIDSVSASCAPDIDTARDTEIWIERYQAIAALTGKVAYLGECGFVAPDQERGQTYDGWLRHLFAEADGQLGLFWQLSPATRTNNDGFAVYSRRDSATAWILRRWGQAIR